MKIGTRVTWRDNKISPHVGTVVDLSEEIICVKWDHLDEKRVYTSNEVREIREGELEVRKEAEKRYLIHRNML